MEFNLDAIAEVILSAGETASVVNIKLCYDTEIRLWCWIGRWVLRTGGGKCFSFNACLVYPRRRILNKQGSDVKSANTEYSRRIISFDQLVMKY